jgi:hypothetical protein
MGTINLNLMPSGQILNKNNKIIDYLFQGNSYLINTNQNIEIFNRNKNKIGIVQL